MKHPIIQDLIVNNYEFTGYLNSKDLTKERLKSLNLDPEVTPKVKVMGQMSVFCNDDECYVEKLEFIAFDHNEELIDLDDHEYDAEQLCDDIVDSGDQGQWYQDRYERMADAAYDRMRDD